jgi:hypothetical protein
MDEFGDSIVTLDENPRGRGDFWQRGKDILI